MNLQQQTINSCWTFLCSEQCYKLNEQKRFELPHFINVPILTSFFKANRLPCACPVLRCLWQWCRVDKSIDSTFFQNSQLLKDLLQKHFWRRVSPMLDTRWLGHPKSYEPFVQTILFIGSKISKISRCDVEKKTLLGSLRGWRMYSEVFFKFFCCCGYFDPVNAYFDHPNT